MTIAEPKTLEAYARARAALREANMLDAAFGMPHWSEADAVAQYVRGALAILSDMHKIVDTYRAAHKITAAEVALTDLGNAMWGERFRNKVKVAVEPK